MYTVEVSSQHTGFPQYTTTTVAANFAHFRFTYHHNPGGIWNMICVGSRRQEIIHRTQSPRLPLLPLPFTLFLICEVSDVWDGVLWNVLNFVHVTYVQYTVFNLLVLSTSLISALPVSIVVRAEHCASTQQCACYSSSTTPDLFTYIYARNTTA